MSEIDDLLAEAQKFRQDFEDVKERGRVIMGQLILWWNENPSAKVMAFYLAAVEHPPVPMGADQSAEPAEGRYVHLPHPSEDIEGYLRTRDQMKRDITSICARITEWKEEDYSGDGAMDRIYDELRSKGYMQ
jgi:hypothetical protein